MDVHKEPSLDILACEPAEMDFIKPRPKKKKVSIYKLLALKNLHDRARLPNPPTSDIQCPEKEGERDADVPFS
jgi:hypothetical protein